MKPGRLSAALCLALAGALLLAVTPVRAGKALEITEDIIARFLRAHDTEQQEKGKVETDIQALDRKIAEWRECATKYREAGDVAGGRAGGLAAKLAIKARCGASSDEGFLKDREKLMERPAEAGLSAGNFKKDQYQSLGDRILSFLNGGTDFTDAEKAVLNAHRSDLAGALGFSASSGASEGGSGGGSRGGHIPSSWAGDAGWGYIGYLFSTMYLSGAMVMEKPYQPGEWTRWQLTDTENPEEKTVIERAFLGKTPEGAEWWRNKSIITNGAAIDTVILESLFKPMDAEGTMRQLVRMRGKLPGDPEPREMMVPQYMSMLSSAAALPFRPTPESIEGATVGSETVGGVTAKHVKFSGGAGGSTIEWWLADTIPGGWVKFVGSNGKTEGKAQAWTLELTGSGNGAKSDLGVM